MIKEIYKYQFPVFKIEAVVTVLTIFVALVLANAIWETTVQAKVTFYKKKGHKSKTLHMHLFTSKWKGFCSYVLCSGSFCMPLHRSFT